MPGAKLSVRKIREILRLKFELVRSHREISQACRVSPSTVWDVLLRFQRSGLEWPLAEDMSDEALENRLYRGIASSRQERPLPDWSEVHRELRRAHVTLALLWTEYRKDHPEEGYEYSRFCELYGQWLGSRCNPVMRQHHRFGEKVFVDFAGSTIPVVCPVTGVVQPAQLFVGVLGGSNYTYLEALPSQNIFSWLTAHVRMFEYFGGCPEAVVPDNLKSGVTKPDFYDPVINPSYQALADHYEVAVLPARVRKPRDKAKAEQGVLIAQRWGVAAMRNRTFYGLASVNETLRQLNEGMNEKPFRKLPGCRRSLFEAEEKPRLRPLPSVPFRVMLRKRVKVYLDYHVEVDGQYFSVPFRLLRQQVEAHYTAGIVEVFHQGRKVATHERRVGQLYHTKPEHMPSHHQFRAEWTPERFQAWAARMGPATAGLVGEILQLRVHPEQAYRACLGILQGLPRRFGPTRVEAACARALSVGVHSYRSLESILEKEMDRLPLPGTQPDPLSAGFHENVRGADYYCELN